MGFIIFTGKILPSSIILGVALPGLLATCMSTISAQFITFSSASSHEVYDKIIRKKG